MAKGRLLALGSTEFIKKNFGVGYHLKLMKEVSGVGEETRFTDGEKEELLEKVKRVIPSCEQNPQSSPDCLVVELPFNQESRFTELFGELERDKKISINLEMNSLEDAFVNIGMEEEKFLERRKSQAE